MSTDTAIYAHDSSKIGGVKRAKSRWGINMERLLGEQERTATDVAEKIGMSTGQFSDLKNNADQNPRAETLQKVADAFGVDIQELFRSDRPQLEARGVLSSPDAPPASAPDPETLRVAVRTALEDVLTDLLIGLTGSAPPSHEPVTGTRGRTPRSSPAASRSRRAIR